MARYTVQTFSKSGSFACPNGTQDLSHELSKAGVEEVLREWASEHPRVGSDESDAYALVWRGEWLADVTDQYPDFRLTFGPRMGIRWEVC